MQDSDRKLIYQKQELYGLIHIRIVVKLVILSSVEEVTFPENIAIPDFWTLLV